MAIRHRQLRSSRGLRGLALAAAGVVAVGWAAAARARVGRSAAAFAGSGGTAPLWAAAARPAAERVAAPRRAEVTEAEVVGGTAGDSALMKLEADLEIQIQKAKDEDNPSKIRDLARLLVLAKTAEGIAVKEGAKDASSAVKTAIADYLTEFTGKEDYTMSDVTKQIRKKCSNAVAALDDIYFEDIANEMALAGEAAAASFTGKEEYEFGDISKEVDARAKAAVSKFTGKADYKFGDISKEVMKRGGDAVKDFTGKDEYKFGDITKTVLKNIFGGEDKK
uniref:Uncharacterized protein n=1 Tax=Zooxanthella nutricula TaxID=1333877 RepID=A0A7S2QK24_9DINO